MEIRLNKRLNLKVTDCGKVLGKRVEFLKPRIDKYGYENISIYIDGKRKTKLLHRIVCETWHENPNNLPTVNHKDGNKLNNHKDNVEWSSVKDNIIHAYNNGLHKTKLNPKSVVYIYTNPDNLNPKQLSKKLNVNRNTVYGVIYDNKWVSITKYLKKNHILESPQKHNEKCVAIKISTGEMFEFENKTKFARENGIDTSSVVKCLKGTKKTSGGFKFYSL